MSHTRRVSVIGLGYVGLPVAVGLGQHAPVIGYDKDAKRIAELQQAHDRNNDLTPQQLDTAEVTFTTDESKLDSADFHIIAVPTPITDTKRPDLSKLISATEIAARHLKRGDIVVYESTVYPGATEEECIPVLEHISRLKCGKDFFVGYSPERINPGDKKHTLENTIKIVSAQDEKTLNIIAQVYETVVAVGVHRVSSIKVAEAAKVIENTQRDLNIALMNELALIFHRLNIDTLEVLSAAETKWNFLPFRPGLVGGHCIGVDPYYLTHKAQAVGYHPEVILAGRRINDDMGHFIVEQTIKHIVKNDYALSERRVAILGLTFKENCPDLRNSRVFDIVQGLQQFGIQPMLCDPLAHEDLLREHTELPLMPWSDISSAAVIILAVAHDEFKQRAPADYLSKLQKKGLVIDVKGILPSNAFASSDVILWRL